MCILNSVNSVYFVQRNIINYECVSEGVTICTHTTSLTFDLTSDQEKLPRNSKRCKKKSLKKVLFPFFKYRVKCKPSHGQQKSDITPGRRRLDSSAFPRREKWAVRTGGSDEVTVIVWGRTQIAAREATGWRGGGCCWIVPSTWETLRTVVVVLLCCCEWSQTHESSASPNHWGVNHLTGDDSRRQTHT